MHRAWRIDVAKLDVIFRDDGRVSVVDGDKINLISLTFEDGLEPILVSDESKAPVVFATDGRNLYFRISCPHGSREVPKTLCVRSGINGYGGNAVAGSRMYSSLPTSQNRTRSVG